LQDVFLKHFGRRSMMKLRKTKKITLVKGNRKVKVPMTDELLTEKQIRKILKQAGISEEEYIRLINEEENDVTYG